MKNKRIDSFF